MSNQKHRRVTSKSEVIESSKERRFIGLDVTVRHATYGVPDDAIMHAVFERIEMIHGSDGKYYITAKIERGRSVALDKIGDTALARTYIASLNALLKMYYKELELDK